MSAHQRRRDALRTYLRTKIARLEAQRDRIDRLLARYRAMLDRLPHPGD